MSTALPPLALSAEMETDLHGLRNYHLFFVFVSYRESERCSLVEIAQWTAVVLFTVSGRPPIGLFGLLYHYTLSLTL